MTSEEPGLARYEQVAESIRRAIRNGTLAPGEQLPSNRELAKQHRVALNTAQRAVSTLRDEGWLVVRPTVGAFVSTSVPESAEDLRETVVHLQATVIELEARLAHVEAAIKTPAE
ncbi:GntR family transcriptional regulator [Amycolatopsis sp. FDAARGOS 1241]|uniref:GntR family transcriptional regulator n=1 Tax=Amycolatopsis sp. FDAARGOS 1241 TaxID=2778070 RepID=UPI00195233EB|nr:GntR family transcriptional regulator [Amycolatopsis sp. FDAARGOS 1241]QRP46905.1 GntR family transcriptional regulator [Amycolatopsis sp. FDAARGOS 1241]